MKISYNWLQNYFDEKLPEPEKISEGIIFHSFEVDEVEKLGNDTILDIKILPDRAHDCLSHFGIAKEISAIFDLKIKDIKYKTFEPKTTNLQIQIEDDKCFRYMGRIVKNIKVGESPDLLKEKLNAIGQKSINNIVDAANFVMFDLGQPIHCFDLDKLENSNLIIRNGKLGEKTTTLDKREINLDESILVIADEKDPLALAGIKGGTKAEVDINTKNIVIEVANFSAISTRKTAKKVNIQTDAVKRYENELTPELCGPVMDSITDLIYSLAGGEVEDVVDIYTQKPEQRVINVPASYINKRLGSNFSKEDIETVWKKLNFEYVNKDDEFEIKIPFLRIDLVKDYDLVEEVIRILGYDRLEEKLPTFPRDDSKEIPLDSYHKMLLIRSKLLNDGYSEVMNYVFRDKGEVEVLASASDKKFLRNNLSDGLKESIKLNVLNLPLLSMKEIKVFEIGTVFFKEKEEMHVVYGDKKAVVEMTVEEFYKKELSDILSYQPEVNTSILENKIFKPWSLYPFITRDIAVWVSENTEPDTLFNVYKELGTDLLVKDPELVDKFQKQDKISYAYRLVFQSYDRTLTDEEITNIMTKITDKITSLGFEVR